MQLVTASQKGGLQECEEAKQLAMLIGWPYVERNKRSLPELTQTYGATEILVVQQKGPALYPGALPMHEFHLSMAQLRILRYDRGQVDHLLEAVGTAPLQSFLDCTAGLGSDSLLVSYAHPECQQMVALEGHAALAYITNDGCRNFQHKSETVTAALRRIQVVHTLYEHYLRQCDSDAYDVVYIDPMFESPVLSSPQFTPLRGHLIETPLTAVTLQEALRVARYRVIVKERPFSHLFNTLPPTRLVAGKYSRIAYGVYEANHER